MMMQGMSSGMMMAGTIDTEEADRGTASKINLEDLQVFQSILNQNEKILAIQSKLNFTPSENAEVQSLTQTLNLFMENQRLL